MKGDGVLHSSESDEWLTPWELFSRLQFKWGFTLDPCANESSPLMTEIASCNKKEDGLKFDWASWIVFCNPPYSAISDWVAKAHSHRHDAVTVMLIPSRTDTKYWHKYIQNDALKVEFLPGRLKFRRPDGGKSTSAPFPSCLVYF
jgi:site-specific DNA-methyltransferase (adenine-specific)